MLGLQVRGSGFAVGALHGVALHGWHGKTVDARGICMGGTWLTSMADWVNTIRGYES